MEPFTKLFDRLNLIILLIKSFAPFTSNINKINELLIYTNKSSSPSESYYRHGKKKFNEKLWHEVLLRYLKSNYLTNVLNR